jgi:hypothetical protein
LLLGVFRNLSRIRDFHPHADRIRGLFAGNVQDIHTHS